MTGTEYFSFSMSRASDSLLITLRQLQEGLNCKTLTNNVVA